MPLMSLAVGASKFQAIPNSTILLVLLQLIIGAVVSTTITVWLHRLKLPHASVACQVRVASKVFPQWPTVLVTVLMIVIVAVPPMSLAAGASKAHATPNWIVLLVLLHVITGAVVSTIVTFWLHRLKLPQESVACQVRVASNVLPQWPTVFVTVLTIVIVLVPLTSLAVGASKIQEVPNSTVLLVLLQVITGAVVSVTITVWLQRLKFPQGSVACHVRVASNVAPQCPLVLVTVLTMVMTMFVLLMSVAVGALKVQAAPNSTVLLVLLQLIT